MVVGTADYSKMKTSFDSLYHRITVLQVGHTFGDTFGRQRNRRGRQHAVDIEDYSLYLTQIIVYFAHL